MFIDAVYKHNPIVALACIPEAIIRIQNIRDYLDETPISTENLVPVFVKLYLCPLMHTRSSDCQKC